MIAQELEKLMNEARRDLVRASKSPTVRWFATSLVLRNSASDVSDPSRHMARWVFSDSHGQRFGVVVEGDKDFLEKGLAIILSEDLSSYGWSEPDSENIRWLASPDYIRP